MLRLGFRRNFLSVLHPNLVSSPIKGILEIFKFDPRCIPMDILTWTDCVGSSVGKNIINRHIFQFKSTKMLIFPYLLQRISDKIIQTSLRTVRHFTEL